MKLFSTIVATKRKDYAVVFYCAISLIFLVATLGIVVSIVRFNERSSRSELIGIQRLFLDEINDSINEKKRALGVLGVTYNRDNRIDMELLDSLFPNQEPLIEICAREKTLSASQVERRKKTTMSDPCSGLSVQSYCHASLAFVVPIDSMKSIHCRIPYDALVRLCKAETKGTQHEILGSSPANNSTIVIEQESNVPLSLGTSSIKKKSGDMVAIESEISGSLNAILRTTLPQKALGSQIPILPFGFLLIALVVIVIGSAIANYLVHRSILKRIKTMNKIIHQEWIDSAEFLSLRSSSEISVFVDSFQAKSRQLHRQIELEQLLREISKATTGMSEETFKPSITDSLRHLGIFSHSDRTYLFLKNEIGGTFELTAHWERKGVPIRSLEGDLPSLLEFFWFAERFRESDQFGVVSIDEIPEDAVSERHLWMTGNEGELAIIAMTLQSVKLKGQLLGFICSELLISNTEQYELPQTVIAQFSEVIATGIDRFRRDRLIKLQNQQLLQAQKMETVGHLAGGIAHDFNNILAGIVSITSLFKMEHEQDSTLSREEFLPFLDTVQEAGNRAAKVVQQLLLLSRKQEYNFATIDLNQVVKSALNIAIPSVDKRVVFSQKLSEGKAVVKADFVQIEQVVLNFIMNSVHAMTVMRKSEEQCGGRLSIVLSQQIADKGFRKQHHSAFERSYWKISISDTGIGIPRENFSKIFDPFFTTKAKGVGTGLGLSMIYRIIQEHYGFVEFESEVGVGTTFTIYLPEEFEDAEDEIVPIPTVQTIESPVHATILVVDDEPVLRQIAGKILRSCGHSVLFAENGGEAVDQFEEHKDSIDLVVLDLVMPILSGRETYIELIKIKPEIAVLISSGFRKDERVDELIEMGVAGFLQKPYTVAEMKCAVDGILLRKG